MEPELIRTYYPAGTNGKIQYQSRLMMYSIELLWMDNPAQVSCAPEGRYEGIKRWSLKFNRHLQVVNVSQRRIFSFIRQMINGSSESINRYVQVVICLLFTKMHRKKLCQNEQPMFIFHG